MNNDDKSAFGFNEHHAGGPSISGSTQNDSLQSSTEVASAIFDSNSEAQEAVSALRQAGASDADLSIIAQSKGTMTTREGGGEIFFRKIRP